MKKLILLFFIFFSLCLYAQSEHLTFKEIPINGKLSDFVEKLKKDGFYDLDLKGFQATMKGKFVGKECDIIITSTPKSNIVWKVSVYLPVDTNWYSIKSSYKTFIEQYKLKYGQPTKSYDFFSDPYYEGDGYEMQALRKEKCHYLSYWKTNLGSIEASISKYQQLKFTYEDEINGNIYSAEKNSNIQSDI